MKTKAFIAGLFSTALMTGIAAQGTQVLAASQDSVNIRTAIHAEVNVPVMFKMDTLAKSDAGLHAALDEKITKYTEGTMIGGHESGLTKVEVKDEILYVTPESITFDTDEIKDLKAQKKQEEEKKKAEEEKKKAEAEKKAAAEAAEKEAAKKAETKESSNWGGSVLSASAGVNMGPSGKETYYNLPMGGVVSIMRGMGNNDEYWVRDDGVKMLGNYVMVAAHLGIRPRGSLVPTSLGMGIVCDTGGFAAGNPTQIDIATAW